MNKQSRGDAHVLTSILRPMPLLFAISACAPGANLPLLPPPGQDAAYQLGSGDQVRIITFGEPGLSGQFSVDESGHISLPLLGELPADGLSTHALADEISKTMVEKQILTKPSVAVEVATYRPVFILGEVTHPGTFPYQPHMTMLSAVAVAGGFTPRAVKERAIVVRTELGRTDQGRVEPRSFIEPGDVVTILERNF